LTSPSPSNPEVAALADTRNSDAIGRLVNRVLRPRSSPSIDAELAAWNAQHRDPARRRLIVLDAVAAAPKGVLARF
jgi:hypothetical protein